MPSQPPHAPSRARPQVSTAGIDQRHARAAEPPPQRCATTTTAAAVGLRELTLLPCRIAPPGRGERPQPHPTGSHANLARATASRHRRATHSAAPPTRRRVDQASRAAAIDRCLACAAAASARRPLRLSRLLRQRHRWWSSCSAHHDDFRTIPAPTSARYENAHSDMCGHASRRHAA